MAKLSNFSASSLAILDVEYLKNRVSWIRDELDPLVAREGPGSLGPDIVIVLFKFFEQLRTPHLTVEAVRDSRLHFALLTIAGRATRWPIKLIDEAEHIIRTWGIDTPEDLEKETILTEWQRRQASCVNPRFASRSGDLGFQPGDWWTDTTFAYRDGIIASTSSDGGVTACLQQAYAILLVDGDELDCTDPEHFTYRIRPGDIRGYRLCAGTLASRKPVRILRSHTLRSFFAPHAGVRYDGIYRISGWRVFRDTKTNAVEYYISLDRVPSQPPMGSVLNHPLAAELDDYREYKRIRKEIRNNLSLSHNELQLGSPGNDSSCTLDRMSVFNKIRSIETKKTVNEPPQRVLASLSVPSEPSEPTSDRTSQTKSEDNPFFIELPAGASVDPFFTGLLQENATKEAASCRLGAIPLTPPPKMKTIGGSRSPLSNGDHEAGGKKCPSD
ncbi:hypothetical protein E4T44_04863 [Aureobasidium sp. EXF-8845]|nr:hypothetical protein E4T44_04863 [Aureobasidium sp. EXF-8845]KAI4852235.1 hypothetical protein E4T45_04787 [Aureobasidium sp. EXF-8846]